MLDFRPVIAVIGLLNVALGVAMLLPAIIDLAANNDNWVNFLNASLVTMFLGACSWVATKQSRVVLTLRQAFLITVASWIVLAIAGALPIYWSTLAPSFTDSFFEAMSGITTTGATVLTGLDNAPVGLLFWRAMLQWLGGLGIIVIAVAVLPMLQIGGMQLFTVEAFETPDKILPRATQISGSITLLFVALTFLCAIAYALAGMDILDAVIHAMTTVATGGFSTKDASIGYFQSGSIELVAMLFMCLGSLPFLLYMRVIQGRPGALLTDSQVRTFFAFLVISITLLWAYQRWSGSAEGLESLRIVAFNTVSIMTGTGYATADYSAWGPFAVCVFFMLMFIGGCAGSTSCGVKVFRFQILWQEIREHLQELRYPNAVFVKKYNGRPVPNGVSAAVMNFLFVYLLTIGVLAILLSFTGLDALTAMSSAATAVSNVGPGLGHIVGPAGTFQSISDTAKWMMSAGMLIGRLELFTVFVVLSPHFWRM